MTPWVVASKGVLAVAAPPALATVAAIGHDDVVRLFLILAIMLLAAKLAGELFHRLGQPVVLGELLAGTLLGASVLGVIPVGAADPLTGVIDLLAEIGVVILLFEVGLSTNLPDLFRVGPAAAAVALVGVVLPFGLGVAVTLSPLSATSAGGDPVLTAVFVGAALTATSVGITARVLKDLHAMASTEAQLVVGAAVIDDVLGLVILGIVASLAAGGTVSALSVAKSLGLAIGFLVVAVAAGLALAPRLFAVIDRLRVRGMLVVSAFAFALLMAGLAARAGSAMIIGAFAAGLVLAGTRQFETIEERIKPIADVFTPIFFLSVGAALDVRLLNPFDPGNHAVLILGGALFVVAVIGKVASGWAAPWRKFNRLAVGVGMVPRGEVGLIFADIGLTNGVLSNAAFSAILVMVIGTTFLAPGLLKALVQRGGFTPAAPRDAA